MTLTPAIEPTLTAKIQVGPLAGLHGLVVATTQQGKTYLQLHQLPGVAVLLPSHLLQLPAAVVKPAN